MFAHQVIDQIKETMPSINNENYKKALTLCFDEIQNSQIFHLGCGDELYPLFESRLDRFNFNGAFMGEFSNYCRLPYKKCWFDYTREFDSSLPENKGKYHAEKGGILPLELENESEIAVFSWSYPKHLKKWILDPSIIFIGIGKPEFMSDVSEIVGLKGPRFLKRDLNSNISFYDLVMPIPSSERDRIDVCILNFALLLLGCKNIETEKIFPPETLNKKRLKHHKQPLFSYHTLVLKPVGKKQESIPRHLWENRIHLCRGHFKTYTMENPLFGKITGRFWWQPAVRGRNRDGIVMKDYEVKAA